jgi:hypothetical protein
MYVSLCVARSVYMYVSLCVARSLYVCQSMCGNDGNMQTSIYTVVHVCILIHVHMSFCVFIFYTK